MNGNWVYVNAPSDEAIVHHEECTSVRGRAVGEAPSGYWTRLVTDRLTARGFAHSTGETTIRNCTTCESCA